jgi:adenylate cyclase
MELFTSHWPSLKILLQRALIGGTAGVIFSVLIVSWQMTVAMNGAAIGLLISLYTSLLDQFLIATRLRRRPFWIVLIVRTVSYFAGILLIIAGVIGLSYSIRYQTTFPAFLHSAELKRFISSGRFVNTILLSLLLMTMLQFIMLITRFFRRSVLFNYLLGRYHQVIEEERIFMFLDIRSSTTIAEQLGHFRWHRLLNDFFFDIGEPIHRSKGEIYQYVGDEVVVSWTKRDGLKDLNCIRCFYGIQEKIKSRRAQYMRRYGLVPEYKAGFHIGKVVAGEIGDFKRDIVFHGDTLNTASRIEEQCNRLGRDLLLSRDLLLELDIKNRFREEYMGNIRLRGKDQELELYSLQPLPRS